MKKEAIFKLKSMFDPADILSLWIVKLSMIRNDIFHVHKRMSVLMQQDDKVINGELSYYFRLASSHYREAVKYIYKYREDEIIQDFIMKLDSHEQDHYKDVLNSCSPWETSFVKLYIKPIRDNFFHYALESFDTDYSNMEDFFTKVVATGKKRNEIDLLFADEVSLNIIFGNFHEEKVKKILSQLSRYMASLISVVDAAIGTYLIIKSNRISYRSTVNK